jgi:hypothetical protein
MMQNLGHIKGQKRQGHRKDCIKKRQQRIGPKGVMTEAAVKNHPP